MFRMFARPLSNSEGGWENVSPRCISRLFPPFFCPRSQLSDFVRFILKKFHVAGSCTPTLIREKSWKQINPDLSQG